MADKKYVPQGVFLACDKGTTPTEFKITNNNNVFLFEEPVANTGDMAPNVNVMPFGACSVKSGSPCMPVPVAWQGFEDGIFIGNFNPLLEDSILPCGLGGKIEIFYSLEEAEAACGDDGMSFWEIVGAAVLVVAAVALIVVTGGAALAAMGAMAAAAGAGTLTVGAAIVGGAGIIAEVAGVVITARALYDYSQDGNEESLFKEVVLGFLFLGVGKVLEKGARFLIATRAGEKAMKIIAETTEAIEDLPILRFSRQRMPNISQNIDEAFEVGQSNILTRETSKSAIRANRRAALRGADDAVPGNSLDEYPFASAKEGGAGSTVKSVPVGEQNIQGGTMSSFYQNNGIQDGDRFIVEIID